MIWLFVILLILYGGFISFALFHALKRINQYENVISQVDSIIEFCSKKIKLVDETGHFESDDEVGFFFEELKNMQNLLSNMFDIKEDIDAEKTKE